MVVVEQHFTIEQAAYPPAADEYMLVAAACDGSLGRHKNKRKYGNAAVHIFERAIEMPRNTYMVLYGLILIVVVVSVDLLFFRNRFWERLMANIGIVFLFAAFYLRFLKKP